MIEPKDIYIIIVTYNGMQWLSKCLKSTIPYPVIIVDNDSSDGTVEFIKKSYPKVKLFEQENNLGFGQANNIGISYALQQGADYVFLLNQDAYLQAGAIEKLIEVHKTNENFGVLSPIHLNGTGEKLDQNFSNYLNYNPNDDFYSDFVLNKPKKKVYEVPFVNAAGWLLSRKCLESVGGFDPIFFHYGEDDNYCQRVAYHGLKIGVVPGSFLFHDRVSKPANFLKPFSKKLLLKRERTLKILHANINRNTNFNTPRKEIKKNLIPALFQLKFKNARFYRQELHSLDRVEKEVLKSRSINVRTGAHYLNLSE